MFVIFWAPYPALALMIAFTRACMDSTFVWNLMTHALPEFSKELLVLSFSVFECLHKYKRGWGQMTVDKGPWQSGLLDLLWKSSLKSFEVGLGHYHAALWILYKDAMCLWSATSPRSVQVPNSRECRIPPEWDIQITMFHCLSLFFNLFTYTGTAINLKIG